MEKKRVLLFATTFMDIYKDILSCLEQKNFEVTWVQASVIPNNPFNKTNNLYTEKNIEHYLDETEKLWRERFKNVALNKPFDYFLAINGLDVHPYMFDYLRKMNPYIRMVLFLYDRVEGVVQIDRFFQYYDEVYSFDIGDTNQFGLHFLPIYWVPIREYHPVKYDIFGFASFQYLKPERTELYKRVKEQSDECGFNSFIKLYYGSYQINPLKHQLKYLIKRLLGQPCISIKEIKSDLYTNRFVSPTEYRALMQQSKSILDTQASYQDGLTARFMWALGEEKKIITTNKNVESYPFYDNNQIYVLDGQNYDGIKDFVNRPFAMSEGNRNRIAPYRIDKWIDTLLGL